PNTPCTYGPSGNAAIRSPSTPYEAPLRMTSLSSAASAIAPPHYRAEVVFRLVLEFRPVDAPFGDAIDRLPDRERLLINMSKRRDRRRPVLRLEAVRQRNDSSFDAMLLLDRQSLCGETTSASSFTLDL